MTSECEKLVKEMEDWLLTGTIERFPHIIWDELKGMISGLREDAEKYRLLDDDRREYVNVIDGILKSTKI